MVSGRKKRKVEDEPIFLDANLFNYLFDLMTRKVWIYKTNRELYELRDKALIALLILTGARISEALKFRRKQFRIYQDRIVLSSFTSLKGGRRRSKVIMPKSGRFRRFTRVFEEWLSHLEDEEHYVFPTGSAFGLNYNRHIKRKRAHQIILFITGKFPHWFRAVCANIYGKLIFNNDAWKLQQFMGWKSLDSSTPYVKGTWEEDTDKIFTV